MTQDSTNSFHVDNGETVNVTVIPVHCANFVKAASFNGITLSSASTSSGDFTFKVSGSTVETPQVFGCLCKFLAPSPPANPDDQHYLFYVKGSDGKVFAGPTAPYSATAYSEHLDFWIN
jgi:hypothetical protein